MRPLPRAALLALTIGATLVSAGCATERNLAAQPRGREVAPQATRVASGGARVVYDRTSAFGRVLVIDEGARRVMRFGSHDGSEQSAMLLGNPRAVPIEYVRYALLGLAHHGRPARVLMVGLGGGTFTTLVHRALPEVTVDAVEIDAAVVDAARAWFGLREDARYRVHVADAADWIRRDRGAYDFVLLDAYAGEDIPAAVGSEAFFRDVAARLAPGAVVAINVAEADESGGAGVARAFAAVFAPFECRRTAVDGNLLIFAAAAPRTVDRQAAARWAAAGAARGVPDFSLATARSRSSPTR
jgi:spermidine synthase